VGLFAIPEIVAMGVSGTTIAQGAVAKIGGVREGVLDTFRHIGLTLRCSMIGTFIGVIPGLGAALTQWMAYAHAVQTSKDKERFGQGAVEGVLGPGAANNSGLGGGLIPTICFGVPGGLTMAILLGAFLIQGITPGPKMLTDNLGLTIVRLDHRRIQRHHGAHLLHVPGADRTPHVCPRWTVDSADHPAGVHRRLL
jgi:TctA family transporter